jgi:hypothetical protein
MRVSETIRNMEEAGRVVMMKDLKKILTFALISGVLTVSSLAAQPQREQREPPPKDPKVFDKRDKEPRREEPRREERDKPKEDKKGKP